MGNTATDGSPDDGYFSGSKSSAVLINKLSSGKTPTEKKRLQSLILYLHCRPDASVGKEIGEGLVSSSP